MSEFKLAATLRIDVKEAKDLIEEYFRTFPKIKAVLTQLGVFAIKQGYTETLQPFSRKRVFPYWKSVSHEIEAHLSGIKRSYLLGKIERAGKNTPIQGAAGDMMKLAIWLVYKHIRDNNLQDKVHILLTVHDQLTTAVVEDFAEEWKVTLDALMLKAATYIIPSGILKADTMVSPVWTK